MYVRLVTTILVLTAGASLGALPSPTGSANSVLIQKWRKEFDKTDSKREKAVIASKLVRLGDSDEKYRRLVFEQAEWAIRHDAERNSGRNTTDNPGVGTFGVPPIWEKTHTLPKLPEHVVPPPEKTEPTPIIPKPPIPDGNEITTIAAKSPSHHSHTSSPSPKMSTATAVHGDMPVFEEEHEVVGKGDDYEGEVMRVYALAAMRDPRQTAESKARATELLRQALCSENPHMVVAAAMGLASLKDTVSIRPIAQAAIRFRGLRHRANLTLVEALIYMQDKTADDVADALLEEPELLASMREIASSSGFEPFEDPEISQAADPLTVSMTSAKRH